MSTENQNVENPGSTENTTEQTTERQYTEIELKAIDQGWIPKEEFDGDDSEFIDAPEFVRRGELFTKIEKQSKELKAVREALKALGEHHSKVKEMEYERAMRALKAERRQATIDGDHERALALEDKIDEIKQEKDLVVSEARKSVAVQEPEGYTPEFQSWVNRNPWYETNRTMRATADALGKELYREGHSPAEVLELVEQEIRKEFSSKFVKPAAARPSAVDASTRGNTKKDDFTLSEEERTVMRKIVAATPGYTEADYIRELKALKNR